MLVRSCESRQVLQDSRSYRSSSNASAIYIDHPIRTRTVHILRAAGAAIDAKTYEAGLWGVLAERSLQGRRATLGVLVLVAVSSLAQPARPVIVQAPRRVSMRAQRVRGPFLTTMAVLFGVLALSNATKAWQHLQDPNDLGIVVFGIRFETFTSNLSIGLAMGLVLATYAYGLWMLRRWVLPLSIAYAFWVPVNLVLFWHRQTSPEIPPVAGILAYLAIALGGSIGTALYLAYHRERLALA
jgi:hypothetical protein